MALTACKECGRQLSTEAVACPHCGAKVPRTSGCAKFFLLIVVIGVIGGVMSDYQRQSDQRSATGRDALLTPEQRAAEDKRAAAESEAKAKKEASFHKVVGVISGIKKANRNPDSVVWESILANDDASVICVEYRGQNGFGGMSREFVVVAKGTASQQSSAWNRQCAGKSLNDMIYARQALR